jgi:hypothetical protein
MAVVLVCLRGNVSLSGDMALSDREIGALVPGAVLRRSALDSAWPEFAGCARRMGALNDGSLPLPIGVDLCYTGHLGVDEIRRIVRRATFVQQVFALPGSDELAALPGAVPLALCRWSPPVFVVLSEQCAVELASLVAIRGADHGCAFGARGRG